MRWYVFRKGPNDRGERIAEVNLGSEEEAAAAGMALWLATHPEAVTGAGQVFYARPADDVDKERYRLPVKLY